MIEVRDLSNTWGSFRLRSISLQVDRGEYLVILGPSGSGKTLFLETVAGLHVPAAGTICIDGRDVTRRPPEERRVGLVYQEYALFPHLSVRDNIGYGLRHRPLTARQRQDRIRDMLDVMDIGYLADRPRPAGLSGGESQKVALARALAIDPDVLLLDEPMSSLDARSRDRIVELLADIPRRLRVPVIHVTHDYAEAAALASRVAVFRHGAVAQLGSVEDVFWRPASRYVAEFVGARNVFDATCLAASPPAAVIRVGNVTLAATAAPGPGPVCVCIRPEEIQLGAPAAERPNTVPVRVREVTDGGFHVRLQVEAAGLTLLVSVPRRLYLEHPLAVGAETLAYLAPACIHVMPCTPAAAEPDADDPRGPPAPAPTPSRSRAEERP